MRFLSCRRETIVAAFLAVVAITGCESEGNVELSDASASSERRAAFDGQVGDEPILAEDEDVESQQVAPHGEAASVEPAVAIKPTEDSVGGGAAAAPDPASSRQLAVVDQKLDPSQFPGGIVPASPTAEPLPGGPRLLVPERNFRLEGRPRALRITYDDLDLLKVLNMGDPLPADVVDQFPDWLRELDGKVVRLRGFMYPAYQQMLSAFILTRDTGVCCFGPNPKVYYLVGVKLKEGTEVRYIENRPFDVVGTFHIDPRYIDGTWYQLYKISDAMVVE